MMVNSQEVVQRISWFVLDFSSKDLDGLPTYDQWVREKVTGNIWHKRKVRLRLVPGFIQTFGQDWKSTVTSSP